jgi:hypothetical protein
VYTHFVRIWAPLVAIAALFGLTVPAPALGWAFPKWLYWTGLALTVILALLTSDRTPAGREAQPAAAPRPAQVRHLRSSLLFGQLVAVSTAALAYSVRCGGMDQQQALVWMLGFTALSAMVWGASQLYHFYREHAVEQALPITEAQVQSDIVNAWSGTLTGLVAAALFVAALQGLMSSSALIWAIMSTIILPGVAAATLENLARRGGEKPLW